MGIGGEHLRVRAELIGDQAAFDRLWPQFVDAYPGYANYLTRRPDLPPRMFRLRRSACRGAAGRRSLARGPGCQRMEAAAPPATATPAMQRTVEEDAMKAAPGDRLVVASTHVDEPAREGEILEARGADGGPPFLVRWSDNGHETLVFPGPDARVQPPAPDGDRAARQAGGLADGELVPVEVGGGSYLVAREGDEVCVVRDKCPRLGLPLSKGRGGIHYADGVVQCPWHNSRFTVCGGETSTGCPVSRRQDPGLVDQADRHGPQAQPDDHVGARLEVGYVVVDG